MKTYTLLFCFTFGLAFGQKPVTTYYDYQKTKKKEVYLVDVNGERNGVYKNYLEDGMLLNEIYYKSGKKHGLYTVYDKFPNYKGVLQVKSKETYVNDLKDGSAVYYMYDPTLGLYEFQKGNYKQDKEDGEWIKIKTFDKIFTYEEAEKIKAIPAFKGSSAIKEVEVYSNGVKVSNVANQSYYYYPSNKLYRNKTTDSASRTTDTYYFPDGKVWKKAISKNGKIISSEAFYYNGTVKVKEVMNPYSYEGYNEDGSQNSTMLNYTREQEYRRKEAKSLNQAIDYSKELAAQNKLDEAISHLEHKIMLYSEWKRNTYSFFNVETEELKFATETLTQLRSKKENAGK